MDEVNDLIVAAELDMTYRMTKKVYSVEGCSPTITAIQGNGQMIKVLIWMK